MYLKCLEINGFKSFKGKIELCFTEGINAIVGPNGSGKSNISDAIRWVIGEQSVKTLRGRKMEDVIFSGSEKAKAAGFAEVTIVLDNTDKGIELDYNEISVTRRMYRSGESEYFINKIQCRLKDLTELFMDTGVGKDGYSIIGQGKIDEILSSRSEDRRAIFEEAAGISKYKYRKLEAEKKMEHTNQNIIRIQDIADEVKNQLDPLREQAEITKKYQKHLHELKTLDVNLIVSSMDRCNKKLVNLENELESLNTYRIEKKDSLQLFESNYEKNKTKVKSFDEQISNSTKEIHELVSLKEKKEGEILICNEKSSYINTSIKKIINDNENLTEERKNIDLDIEKNNARLELIRTELDRIRISLDVMETEYNEKYSTINGIENSMTQNKKIHLDYLNELSEIKSKISALDAIVRNVDNRIKQINVDNDVLIDQFREKWELHSEIKEKIESITKQLSNAKKVEKSFLDKKKFKEEEIQQIEEMLVKKRSSKDNIFSRLSLLEEMEKEYGGYNKTVKNLLMEQRKIKDIVKGFQGVVGELISVPKAYSTAIEAALGFAVQNIVTDCEEDAKELINYLKRNKLGKATFLPITSIKPRTIKPNELKRLKNSGFINIAAELVKYENKYKNIIYNLLGRIAIVDNIDNAIRIGRLSNYDIKIVTLDGEIISAGGAITGGSKSTITGSILARKNQITELKKKYSIILKEFEDLGDLIKVRKTDLMHIESKILKINEEMHNHEIDYSNMQNKLNYVNNDIDLIKAKQEINNKDIEDLTKEKEENLLEINKKSEELKTYTDKSRKILSEIEILEEKINIIKESKDIFNKDLTSLRVKEAELKEKNNSIEQTLLGLTSSKETIKNKIQDNILSMEKEKHDYYLIKTKEKSISEEVENLKMKLLAKENEYKSIEENRIKEKEKSEPLEDNIKECQKDLSNITDSLYKIELQKTRTEIEIENLELKLLDTYELNYNNAVDYKIENFNISKSTKRIEELKENIKELGTVNVNAITEYERLNARHDFLLKQLNDLEMAKDSLIVVIKEIINYMEKQFLDEFEKINRNFNIVFGKLFGGGTAQVILVDKENVLESGIDIVVKPLNKKQQSLMLMSGGERALTAIALLFGILLMKPVPFCVLDEIDSALDDANVDRYATYLKELSKDLQFVIITHRKGSMEMADCLYGVSMEDTGTSALLSVKFEEKVS